LKVNEGSARVRVSGEEFERTFRSGDACGLVPGQIASLTLKRRWTWRGDAYASGSVEHAQTDVAGLALKPLPLSGGDLVNLREDGEPYRRPDPYAPLWRRLTALRRPSYEMDAIAWGAFPRADPEDNPTCDAADLREAGDDEGARALLMDSLHRDLRCVDAHAGLGNLEFDRSPSRALLHYELGVRIAELSLPSSFDGALPWARLYNRPFLRCLHGLGLCLWRLGRRLEAEQVFERLLAFNPNDNQGVRFCWHDVRSGRSWEEAQGAADNALH
jgi:tetratricopeptide (TPR) repeat protein